MQDAFIKLGISEAITVYNRVLHKKNVTIPHVTNEMISLNGFGSLFSFFDEPRIRSSRGTINDRRLEVSQLEKHKWAFQSQLVTPNPTLSKFPSLVSHISTNGFESKVCLAALVDKDTNLP